MIIVIDGPEKVGKSTFITKLVSKAETTGLHVIRGHMKRPSPADQNVYRPLVQLGIRADTFIILDRSWISEVVYNTIMKRESTFKWDDGQRYFGQYVDIFGQQIILWEEVELVEKRRDSTDHPISPLIEQETFLAYAKDFSIEVIKSSSPHIDAYLDALVKTMCELGKDIQRENLSYEYARRYFEAIF